MDEVARDPDSFRNSHTVQFYSDDAQLIGRVADFFMPGIEAGEGALAVSTTAHRQHLRSELIMRGVDIAAAEAAGQFVLLDAAATLRRFMREGFPDREAFEEVVGSALDLAGQGGRQVRVFGEMVSLLWLGGQPESALALEQTWNWMRGRRPLTLLCGYPIRIFTDPAPAHLLSSIANAHSKVAPVEGFALRV